MSEEELARLSAAVGSLSAQLASMSGRQPREPETQRRALDSTAQHQSDDEDEDAPFRPLLYPPSHGPKHR